jgi:hypothetical protein
LNNLFRYKIGDAVLLGHGDNGQVIEATIMYKVAGSGKRPSLVKVQSSKALYAFSEKPEVVSQYPIVPTPQKTAWLSTKEWNVRALVKRGAKDVA